MRIDLRLLAIIVAVPVLGACEHDDYAGGPKSTFGEANRQTMMAQIVDPAPVYETVNPPTSGDHAGQAVKRYNTDTVKKPERVRSTQSASGGGSGGGGGG